jgi:hypothetical protein
MMRSLRQRQILRSLAIVLCLAAGWRTEQPAAAQSLPSAKEHEEAQLRLELERIIAEHPQEAANARKALASLDKPESTPAGRQARGRGDRGARRIVNGLSARGYAAVGALLQGNDPRAATAWCTATLVGCDKVLTAAHCIAQSPSPGAYLVFFQELGFFPVKEIRWPQADYTYPYFDLAMLTLARPVEGIAPLAINMTTKPLNKSMATIVGFGRTGGAREDYGIKREGSVKTEACSPFYAERKLLCWAFDADVKSRPSPSNTCNGDSGGGVLMRDNDGLRIVQKVFGVVSGGRDKGCVKSDESFNVDVMSFRAWIETAGEGRLSSRMCGSASGPQVEAEARRELVRLRDGEREAAIRLDVPAGTVALRVAMNGEDDGQGKNDFDLLVYRGTQTAGASPACDDNGPGQFAFCDIARPQPGPWTIVVRRNKGSGDAQITATLVGGGWR